MFKDKVGKDNNTADQVARKRPKVKAAKNNCLRKLFRR